MDTTTRSNPLLRLLAVATLAFAAFAATSASAGAAEACVIDTGDYGPSVVLATSVPSADNGTTVDIIGSGFPADCDVTLQVDGVTIATVTTGPDGGFTFPWAIPGDYPAGSATVAAVTGGEVIASTVLEITDAQPAGGGTTVPTPTTTPGGTTPGGSTSGSTSGGQGTGSSGGSGTGLAATGAKVLPFALGGIVMLAVGAGLLVTTRRRTADI